MLELAPGGNVKIGRSSSITKRLSAHISNARFGGGSVARVFSVAVVDAAVDERILLREIASMPGVRLYHGSETFSGVTFEQACATTNRVARGLLPGAGGSTDQEPSDLDLVLACARTMERRGITRIALTDLCEALGLIQPAWRYLTPRSLSTQLRAANVKVDTVYLAYARYPPSSPKRGRGRTTKGVKLEWLLPLAAA